jgi:hypothetical protein
VARTTVVARFCVVRVAAGAIPTSGMSISVFVLWFRRSLFLFFVLVPDFWLLVSESFRPKGGIFLKNFY